MLVTREFYPSEEVPTLAELPKIIDQMVIWAGEKSAMAVFLLYRMCDHSHRHHRVPMVAMALEQQHRQPPPQQPHPGNAASPRMHYTLLPTLVQLLRRDVYGDVGKEGLVYACLVLNNLSVPVENKPVIAESRELIEVLRYVIEGGREKNGDAAYVCCICLLNLALWEPNVDGIFRFDMNSCPNPQHSPSSLLRTLEAFLELNSRVRLEHACREKKDSYWACMLLETLTKSVNCAELVAKTRIPDLLLQHISASPWLPSRWTPDSLESASLSVLLNLAERAKPHLVSHACWVVRPIVWEDSLDGLKAIMFCAFIGVGIGCRSLSASTAILELISNQVERRGKERRTDFQLSTAIKAFGHLVKWDSPNAPGALTLCIRIISDYVDMLAKDDALVDSLRNTVAISEYASSADSAVDFVSCMRLSLLHASPDPPRRPAQIKRAAGEISRILVGYAELATVQPATKEKARRIAQELEEVAGAPNPPNLEILLACKPNHTYQRPVAVTPLDRSVEVDRSGPIKEYEYSVDGDMAGVTAADDIDADESPSPMAASCIIS